MPAACTLPRGELLVESQYFQNASAVGGTALAAYPLFRLRSGATSRLELLLDSPSQVAQSGVGGAGLYLRTNPGLGVNYALVGAGRLSLTAGAEVQPPVDRYSPDCGQQPKYTLHFAGLYQVDSTFALTGFVGASTSRRVGVTRDFPGASVGAKIHADQQTDVSIDVGSRFIARLAHPQSFGDISVERLFGKRIAVDVGLGTSFNPVIDTKSHYLAAGVNFRL